MDEKQIRVTGECLNAAASGRFFEDWEFQTLFGLERAEVARIAADWPHVDQKDEIVNLAIHNSFVNLIGFPIDRPKDLPCYLSVSREELRDVFNQWRGAKVLGGLL